MKITVITLVCVSFAVIYHVEPLVTNGGWPDFMGICFGFYKKRTNLEITPAGALHSICANYYSWFKAEVRNAQRGANAETLSHCSRFGADVKRKINRHKIKRQKRQAGIPVPEKGRKKRIRKEIRMMTDHERRLFFAAVNSAKKNMTIAPNKYDAMAEFHTGISSMSAHGGCNFHGWHRMYILMIENALREEAGEYGEVTMPYWDSRIDSRMDDPSLSAIWSDRLMGTCEGDVKGGIMGDGWDSATGIITRLCGADGPLMTDEMIYNVTSKWNFGDICGEDSEIYFDCEFQHNGPHRYIGGQMASLQSAVYDPIFWLHHCFMDLVWEMFRQNQIKHGVDPETDYPPNPTTMGAHEMQVPDAELGFGQLLVADGLSNMFTEEWYEYAPPPTCTEKNPDCGSVYLKCVVDHPNGQTRAMCVGRTLAEVLEAEKPKPEPCPVITTPYPTPAPTPAPTAAPTPAPTLPPTPGPTTPYPHPGPKPKPKAKPPTHVQPVQNTFCLNGKSDINQWVYVPVKIIFRRPPDYTDYGSYPVERGKIQKTRGDIYSPSAYSNVYRHLRNTKTPAKYQDCLEPDVPTNTIYVSSLGLNYEGVYKEYAIIDRRLAVTVATAYIAVRKPMSTTDQSVAMLHAQDKCGRACKPVCKVPGTEIFRPCSGAISVSGGRPLQFGNSFGDAVLNVWDFNKDKDCPQMSTETMVVSFYCDFKTDWMWPSVDPPPKSIHPKPTPPPVVAACSFGWGCIVLKPCSSLTSCKSGDVLTCEKSCNLFATCFRGKFYVRRCLRNETYSPKMGRCIQGICNYRKSRKEVQALTDKLKIGRQKKKKNKRRGSGRG